MQIRICFNQFFLKSAIIGFLAISSISLNVNAQVAKTFSIIGYVKDGKEAPIYGAVINLSTSAQSYTSNKQGKFIINNIKTSKNKISISFLGKKAWIQEINLEKPVIEISINLKDDEQQLAEVTVEMKSAERAIREQPVLTQVISTKKVSEQPTTMVELLNRSAGIRVRQSGGLGSSANVAINGFQGRSVKFFKDGIPINYLGSGFDISLLPVNMLDHVEVYKGVLPRDLGADALGAAINLVTKTALNSRLDFSYEIGSFQTNRASLNLFHKSKSGIFIGADAFANYAKNNYSVDVQIVDSETGAQNENYTEVELFHNRFKNYYTEVYAGVSDKSWADKLRLGVTAFEINRELPFGSTMSKPFGAVKYKENSIIPTLRYAKALINKKLTIDQFLVANTLNTSQIDTARGQYDWFGNYTASPSQIGEVSFRGSLAKIKFFNYTSKTAINYTLSDQHTLGFNVVFSGFDRKGNDPFGRTFNNTNTDVLSAKATYQKTVATLGLDSKLWSDRINNSFIVKYFSYTTKGTDADSFGFEVNGNNNKGNSWGVANATKFQINHTSYLRVSAEYALRLPEQDELFGDGGIQLSNFALKPERSTNLNLGYRIDKKTKYSLELNTFYRITKDLILTAPYNVAYLRSNNFRNVKGLGVEADFNVTLFPWLSANTNFSYQDMRLYNEDNILNEKSRISNTPYFFANAGLNGSFRDLLTSKDRLQVYWYFAFVGQYYLNNIPKNKEPNGFLGLWGNAQIDARNIIPNQSQHNLGFTYFPSKSQLSFGFQAKNVLNADVFDNFRLQNAGRAFYLKINFTINK